VARVRVHSLVVSLDGYAAGPDQSVDAPFGVGGQVLTAWYWDTRFGRAMIGQDGGAEGVDDAWLARGVDGIGATVMGRNMFGPVRGEWPDYSWRGWWGEEPPYHHPVFVLTHHARPPLEMTGTTFHFVTDGLESALAQAAEAAGGLDVRIGGGASTVGAALRAGLVDDIHLAVVPVLMRGGERLYEDLGSWPEGYSCVETAAGEGALHVRFERTA
jgi:dihydrofolate reductase